MFMAGPKYWRYLLSSIGKLVSTSDCFERSHFGTKPVFNRESFFFCSLTGAEPEIKMIFLLSERSQTIFFSPLVSFLLPDFFAIFSHYSPSLFEVTNLKEHTISCRGSQALVMVQYLGTTLW